MQPGEECLSDMFMQNMQDERDAAEHRRDMGLGPFLDPRALPYLYEKSQLRQAFCDNWRGLCQECAKVDPVLLWLEEND